MLLTMRGRASQESGFTLIELLIVILIIGILAAIAIPSFINQKAKAVDASGKELARTAQTVAETISTDNAGNYSNVSLTNLVSYEPTIDTVANSGQAYVSTATGTASGYTVVVTSIPTNNTFTVIRTGGTIARSCSPANTGGCPPAGTW